MMIGVCQVTNLLKAFIEVLRSHSIFLTLFYRLANLFNKIFYISIELSKKRVGYKSWDISVTPKNDRYSRSFLHSMNGILKKRELVKTPTKHFFSRVPGRSDRKREKKWCERYLIVIDSLCRASILFLLLFFLSLLQPTRRRRCYYYSIHREFLFFASA